MLVSWSFFIFMSRVLKIVPRTIRDSSIHSRPFTEMPDLCKNTPPPPLQHAQTGLLFIVSVGFCITLHSFPCVPEGNFAALLFSIRSICGIYMVFYWQGICLRYRFRQNNRRIGFIASHLAVLWCMYLPALCWCGWGESPLHQGR
jgi:hypothetical protein